jgi:hypothetical protein
MSTSAGDTIPGNTSSTFNIGLTGYPNGAGTKDRSSAADQDFIRIFLNVVEKYEFRANDASPLDTRLNLRNSAGTQLAFHDDFGGNNSRLQFTPGANGNFFRDVGGFDTSTGAYGVGAREPLASLATFSSGSLVGARTGFVQPNGDHDWHALNLTAGQTYHSSLRGSATNGGTLADPELYLRNNTGALVTSNDDGGIGFDSFISFTPTTTGRCYLDAGEFGNNATGSYSLTARTASVDDATATAATTGRIGIAGVPNGAGSTAGLINSDTDQDWQRITLRAGELYQFRADSASDATSGILDPTLALRNSAGAQLAFDDDGGDGLDSLLQFRATTTGTYYLDVGGFGSSTGAYVAQACEVPATTATYSSLTPGGSTTGDLHAAGDHDWTAISLAAGTAYTFDLRGSATSGGTLVDSELFLRNSAGTILTSDDDGGVGLDSRITFTPTASSTYFLDAGEFGNNAAGSCTLSAAGTAFDVVINYTGDPSSSGEFTDAALRWEDAITGDLPDVATSPFGAVDDLEIEASVVAIDGPGGTLGQATWDGQRSAADGRLPYHGFMQFDSADVANLVAQGTFDDVILHEMGHVLGLSASLWNQFGLITNTTQYTGQSALAEYRTLANNPGLTFVPLEDAGGPGTAGQHWDEETFNNELMTGFLDSPGANPLSRLTIGSLDDLGYVVDYSSADPYSLPPGLNIRGPENYDLIV